MFKFKEFEVKQEKAAMKVSSDAVLFGAWIDKTENPRKILDIGTGSGVLALMMAQKFPNAEIYGIDIDKDSSIQAEYNFKNSKWKDRLFVINEDFIKFSKTTSDKFDLIISNPPFFDKQLKPPEYYKKISRHTETLPFENFVIGINQVLEPKGIFFVILPLINHENFVHLCNRQNLFCSKKTIIKHDPNKTPKRILIKFTRKPEQTIHDELIIKINGEYTEEYIELTKNYYLFF